MTGRLGVILWGILVSTVCWSNTYAGYYNQTLNPQDPSDSRTFKQRYFFNSDHASGVGAPVLYVIGGEQSFDDKAMEDMVGNLAGKLHAHVVGLEHRYYGESQPFKILSLENLVYLKIENALSDLARFQSFFTKKEKLAGRWIAVGASYAGALAAFYRQRHPELVVGALASSPMLKYSLVNHEHDQFAARALGPQCLRNYREKVLGVLEVAGGAEMAKYKSKIDADAFTDLEFLRYVAFEALLWVQMDGSQPLCEVVERSRPINKLFSSYKKLNAAFGLGPGDFAPHNTTNEHSKSYTSGFGMRQWMYQSCTEIGGFVAPSQDPSQSLQAQKVIAMSANHKRCQSFGHGEGPNVELTNQSYYQKLLDPQTSQILYVNGSQDPTSLFSISPENGNAVNPNTISYTIVGGKHCNDLDRPKPQDSAQLKAARTFEYKVLSSWIKN